MTVRLVLFAAAREAAGRSYDEFDESEVPTVAALLAHAGSRYGEPFGAVLRSARVWLNGDDPPEGPETALAGGDEVAVLPPVSGGA